jgi:RND family efflux transporter MFP subunit
MNKVKLFLTLAGAFCLLTSVTSCSRQGETLEKTAEPPPVAVEAIKAASRDFVESVEVVGSLNAKFKAEVRSEYPGIVREVFVTEWVPVKKGDPLVRLDAREAEALVKKAQAAVEAAKAQKLQAEVACQRAEREFNRLVNLKKHGLATQQALDDMATEKEAAQAKVKAATAELKAAQDDLDHARTRLSKTVIYAPMDGVVASRDVNVGNMVEAGGVKVLFSIVDNRLLDLTVTVPSRYMGVLKVGQPIRFTTAAYPEESFVGHVKFINPTVNESDRSIKVIAEVRNEPERLKDGLFVKGEIITGERKGVLLLPRSALLTWDIGRCTGEIFVVEAELAHRREVKTRGRSGEQVEIVEGLKGGELVISRGGFNVKEGDRVKVIESQGAG